MTPEQIAEKTTRGAALWKQLTAQWDKLKLPGSRFSPHEFIASLLLSELTDQSPDEIATRVRRGKEMLDALKREHGLSLALMGDVAPILTVTLLAEPSERHVVVQESTNEPVVSAPSPESNNPLPSEGEDGCASSEAKEKVEINACPHCAHDFAKCEAGGYASLAALFGATPPTAPSPLPLPSEGEGDRKEKTEPPTRKTCCHVDKEGNCLACAGKDTEITTCDNCNEDFVAARSHRCKNEECDKDFCDGCAEDNLNKRGYCNDCDTVECNRCNDSIERDDEKRCFNEKCGDREYLCEKCAGDLLTTDGRCGSCASEKEVDCSDCNDLFIESRLEKCGGRENEGGDDCGNAYCAKCAPKNLNDKQLCDSCVG